MEQSKKRDHKIFITEQAIEKVPLVKLPGFSNEDALTLWREHRELLHDAKENNDSNEVLTVLSLARNRKVRRYGDEFSVNIDNDPEAVGLFSTAQGRELAYLHNHPSTNGISFPDIFQLIRFAQIGLLTVVTNQGELYALQKLPSFSFPGAYPFFQKFSRAYDEGNITQEEAAKQFLKGCKEVGLHYEKSL